MLNCIVRNRTVGSFNWVYQQKVFAGHIFNIYAKTVFDMK